MDGAAPPSSGDPAPAPRRSRLHQARVWHPRGRTVGDLVQAGERPTLRLIEGGADRDRTSTAGRTDATSRTDATNRTFTASRTSTASRAATAERTSTASRTGSATGSRRIRRPLFARRTGSPDTRPNPAPPRLANSGARLRQATALVLALFVVLGVRLVVFQFTDAPTYAAEGLRDRLRPVDLPAPRGSIVDRNGAILAGSAEARYVFADPSRVEDPVAAAEALSPVLGVPVSQLLPKLVPHRREDGSEVLFEYLARGVPVATGERVRELGLAGIGVDRDETRVVPGHDLAANVVGFTGRDLQGLAGLEAAYDELLRGVNGRRSFEVGQREVNLDHEIPSGYREEIPARPGRSLQLTIDRDLQFEVQRILGEAMTRAGAWVGAAVVLDVRTGEILAQASYPFYDAANPLASREEDRRDVATGWTLEPGSVHKAIVLAACLEEGVVSPTDTIPLPNEITKGATTFRDVYWHPPMARFTLPGILAWSSNVGTITLADRLGAQKLYEYQRAFGLGELTASGLPGESAGLVQPPENWAADAYGSVPIGHAVSVTPLQMAAVYAAIANGGVYVKPHLVKAIIDPDGTVTPTGPPETRRVLSAETATVLRSMLEAVVTAPDATGRTAAVDDYRVAGKTGTGRVIVDGVPGPGEVGSFIGMAPADAPRYVVAVFAHTPGGSGGVVAGPAFAEIMEQTLLHYRIAPTGSRPPEFTIYEQ
jgi:cell division protein FtsI (penicillin-binding protein 3)